MNKYQVISFDAYNTIFNVEKSIRLLAKKLNSKADKSWQDTFWVKLSRGIKDYFVNVAPHRRFENTTVIYKYALEKSSLVDTITCSPDEAIRIIKLAHKNSTLIPDLLGLIKQLKQNYRIIAVLSDIDNEILRASLLRNNITFDIMLTSETAKGYKSNNTNVFSLLSEIVTCKPIQVLHIGDSVFDIIGSKKVGFQACLFNPMSHLAEEIKGINYLKAKSVSDIAKLTIS